MKTNLPFAHFFCSLLFISFSAFASPKAPVLIFHGLGGSPEGITQIFKEEGYEIGSAGENQVWVPQGNHAFGGSGKLWSWFTVRSADLGRRKKLCAEMIESSDLMAKTIAQKYPKKKVVVSGHSQGGMMALLLGVRFPHLVKEVVAVSAMLPECIQNSIVFSGKHDHIKFTLIHGELDEVVRFEFGEQTHDWLNLNSEKTAFLAVKDAKHAVTKNGPLRSQWSLNLKPFLP